MKGLEGGSGGRERERGVAQLLEGPAGGRVEKKARSNFFLIYPLFQFPYRHLFCWFHHFLSFFLSSVVCFNLPFALVPCLPGKR